MQDTPIKLVLIDNIDSFTYNLVDEIRTLGIDMTVFRNTVDCQTVLDKLQHYAQSSRVILMLSPGPGEPSQAGCMPQLLNAVKGQYPVLGICLGHQAIVQSYAGEVSRAPQVMHGKASLMTYIDTPETREIFTDLPQPLSIARYHSLVASKVPDELSVIAHIDDLPMAILHVKDNMLGFQFHPESILTANGSKLLKQSIEYLAKRSSLTKPSMSESI